MRRFTTQFVAAALAVGGLAFVGCDSGDTTTNGTGGAGGGAVDTTPTDATTPDMEPGTGAGATGAATQPAGSTTQPAGVAR